MTRAWALASITILALIVPAAARAQPMPMAMDDRTILSYVSFDELEIVTAPEARPVAFSAQAWIGGDFNKVWMKARGEQPTHAGMGELESHLLYGRVVAPFWDVQTGLRLDTRYGDGGGRTRSLLEVGLQGLAPYWFDLESTLFVSQDGDVSARLQASYELLFTQRLILEPEMQLDIAIQDVPSFGVKGGLSAIEASARARYEIIRELAPYVGISWVRRAGGDGTSSFLAGIRWWH